MAKFKNLTQVSKNVWLFQPSYLIRKQNHSQKSTKQKRSVHSKIDILCIVALLYS